VLRTIFGWTWIVIFTLSLGAMAFLTFPFDRRGHVIHRYARWWGWLILRANGVRVAVQGKEYLDERRPRIYVCNHQGSFDIFSLLAYLRVPFRWLAKAELFRIPILGWAMRTAGYISLDRSAKKKAYQSMEMAARMIGEGTSVVIFPEGARSFDGALQPFMKGGFTLAIKAGVPICPVTIAGSWQIMPRTTLRIKKGDINIIISEPIETKGLTMQDRGSLMQEVEDRIREGLTHAT
jgi:1-acyl-sn-glycerol-3-phosphate acyltransferase